MRTARESRVRPLSGEASRWWRRSLRASVALASVATPLAAQAPDSARVNIYRYVLDVDPPDAAAFVALDVSGPKVLRGSAPKPFMASVTVRPATGQSTAVGGALDLSPYYLFGGGLRTLRSYRANSVAGRLLRVLTKTVVSVGAITDPSEPDGWRAGFALRTTFHDPHDPVLNSRLPETVDSLLDALGVEAEPLARESLADLGVDLAPVFARYRRQMRARGDVQVTAGWGLAGRVAGGALDADSLEGFRSTLWITGQHATGDRYDVLLTAALRNAFRSDGALRVGAGVQRKSEPADLRSSSPTTTAPAGCCQVAPSRSIPATGCWPRPRWVPSRR
ncbi:MAG: hypothetical protein R2909_11890 [Gemmatimonadales bacterium]